MGKQVNLNSLVLVPLQIGVVFNMSDVRARHNFVLVPLQIGVVFNTASG